MLSNSKLLNIFSQALLFKSAARFAQIIPNLWHERIIERDEGCYEINLLQLAFTPRQVRHDRTIKRSLRVHWPNNNKGKDQYQLLEESNIVLWTPQFYKQWEIPEAYKHLGRKSTGVIWCFCNISFMYKCTIIGQVETTRQSYRFINF